jgi:hypothetical protein
MFGKQRGMCDNEGISFRSKVATLSGDKELGAQLKWQVGGYSVRVK